MADAKIYLKKQNENSPKLRAIFLNWVLIFCWGSIVADAEIYLSKGHEFNLKVNFHYCVNSW